MALYTRRRALITLGLGLPGALALAAGARTRSGAGQAPAFAPEPADRLEPSFVGEVAGTEAFVGIALFQGGTEFLAYVCDGDPDQIGRRGAFAQWFRGTVGPDGTLDRTAPSGIRLTATLRMDGINGMLTFAEGAAVEFRAERASGAAGLYRAERMIDGVPYVLGWVHLPDGRARGSNYPPYIRTIEPGCQPNDTRPACQPRTPAPTQAPPP